MNRMSPWTERLSISIACQPSSFHIRGWLFRIVPVRFIPRAISEPLTIRLSVGDRLPR